MYQILTLNKISPIGLEKFDRSKYVWGEEIASPDAVMVRSASMHDMDLPGSVLAVARAGAGVNNIPLDACAQKGIVVFNTPGANANAVKEMVILGLMMASRKVAAGMKWVQGLQDPDIQKQIEKGKGAFTGPEIMGKKLGVVGLGAIGVKVANAALALGMTVYGYDPYLSVEAAWSMSSGIRRAATLAEIYENCDYITLHLPCNGETKGMINASSLATMKQGVRLINFARGELVVTADLMAAIGSHKVSAYVTDFPAEEMLGVEAVVAFPHLGASTPESEDNCAVMAAGELSAYLETGNITNSVNLPSVSLPRTPGMRRACVIHLNVSGLINRITSVISAGGGNIENMISGSRKEYAYTIFDLSGNVPADLAEKLDAVPDVIRSRVI